MSISTRLCTALACWAGITLTGGCYDTEDTVPGDLTGYWAYTAEPGIGSSVALDARLTLDGFSYDMSYRVVLTPGGIDTATLERSESGAYTVEAQAGYSTSGATLVTYGTLFFAPYDAEPWECDFISSTDSMRLYNIHADSIVYGFGLARLPVRTPSVSDEWAIERLVHPVHLIADGRGDGVIRLYGLCDNAGVTLNPSYTIRGDDTLLTSISPALRAGLMEQSFVEGAWKSREVALPSLEPSPPLLGARCRLDRRCRLYVGAGRPTALYELAEQNGIWSATRVFPLVDTASVRAAICGSVRHDSTPSLLLFCTHGAQRTQALFELRHADTGWAVTTIADSLNTDAGQQRMLFDSASVLACADVLGTGRDELFTFTRKGYLFRYSWSPSTGWVERLEAAPDLFGVPCLDCLQGSRIRAVRGPDACFLLVDTGPYGVWHLSRPTDAWTATRLCSNDVTPRAPVAAADLRGDGTTRVYYPGGGCSTTYRKSCDVLLELICTHKSCSESSRFDIGDVDALTAGAGRGDSVSRLYITQRQQAFELSYRQ